MMTLPPASAARYPILNWTWGPVQVRAMPDQAGGYHMQTYREGRRASATARLTVPSAEQAQALCLAAAHDLAERTFRTGT